jgi:hypothetical protein
LIYCGILQKCFELIADDDADIGNILDDLLAGDDGEHI